MEDQGLQHKSGKSKRIIIVCIVASGIIATVFFSFLITQVLKEKDHFYKNRARSISGQRSRPPVVIGQIYKTSGGYAASLSRTHLVQAISYISQGDEEEYARMISTGKITILEDGVEVYIDDIRFFHGLIKVRPKGQIKGFWTVIEAVGK